MAAVVVELGLALSGAAYGLAPEPRMPVSHVTAKTARLFSKQPLIFRC